MERVKGALAKYSAVVLGAGLCAVSIMEAQEAFDYETVMVQVATQAESYYGQNNYNG